ncbi:MAG: CpsB/CapC family capsule biosynthesis tyrosine phosphatase [Acidobacteriota bacterium]
MIDIHSHILPSIDDGSESIEESVETCLKVAEYGTTAIVATPHMHDGTYVPRAIPELNTRLEALRAQVGNRIQIVLGCELRFTENTVRQLCMEQSVPTLNGSRYVLLEFPPFHLPHGYREALFELLSRGIVPVIAHPECNRVLMRYPEKLVQMIEMGCVTQLDAMSLTGEYGPEMKAAAQQMLLSDLLHIVASDTHGHRRRPRLHAGVDEIEKLCGPDAAFQMVVANPKAIIENRPLPYLPEPMLKPMFSARWSAFVKSISYSFSGAKKKTVLK